MVAAGPGKTADDGKLVPMGVKPGDKVIFNKYAGTEVKIDGEELLTLAVGLGCFPFDYGTYLSQSDSLN